MEIISNILPRKVSKLFKVVKIMTTLEVYRQSVTVVDLINFVQRLLKDLEDTLLENSKDIKQYLRKIGVGGRLEPPGSTSV